MLSNSLAAATALILLAKPASAAYSLTKAYEGSTFFDGWSFYGGYDNTTHGSTTWASSAGSLAYVSSSGETIIKVDNTTTLAAGTSRASVKITSDELYGIGTLQVWDATHVPYGCSVWPAMWSVGANWPALGEIDTYEAVNNNSYNSMTLHTSNGCTAAGTSATETGTLIYANCSAYESGNPGCGVTDNTGLSTGAAFASNGGGVWATQLAPTGVSVWFFPRSEVPDDLMNSSMIPVPSGWGTPSAYFGNSTCDIADHFGDQQLTINIALCGDWAGAASVFDLTCSGTCTDLVADPSNYDEAYFSIKSVRVYTDPSLVETSNTVSTTSAAAGTTATASTAKQTTSSAPASTAAAAAGSTSTSGADRIYGGTLTLLSLVAGAVALA